MVGKINYDGLWRILIDKKIRSCSELSRRTGVSESTLSKMKRNEFVMLGVLVKICNYLDCTLNDIVEIETK